MAWKPLNKVLITYVTVVIGLAATALGVVAFTKTQAGPFLTGIFWLFVVSTLLALRWAWYEYHAYMGWYFRCGLWNLCRDLAPFARNAVKQEIMARLPGGPEFDSVQAVVLGQYYLRFDKRLGPLLLEGKDRGCFTEEALAQLRAPQSIDQVSANAVRLTTLAIYYRRF